LEGENVKLKFSLRTLYAAVLACLPALAASADTKVVAGIPTAFAPYMSGIVYAKTMGFFKEEGLDVEFISVQGSGVLIPQVVNKAVTFGAIVPDLPTVAMGKGEPYPIQFFYNAYPKYLFEFVVLKDSPIQSLADLKGKKLGVGALTFGNIPLSRAMLQQSGVTWMKDVEVLPVGVGPAAWKRLTDKEIDVLNLFAHQHEVMEVTGIPIRRLPLPDGFDKLFSNGWIAHSDTVKQNPNLVARFGRAYAKGNYACSLDVEKCLKAWWLFDPASRPAKEKEAEWVKMNIPTLKVDVRHATEAQPKGKWGLYDEASWKQYLHGMKAGEQIPDENLDLSKLYTNAFIDQINGFDAAEVKAAVEKFKVE
jgi:NitT/TauT family transport system substrate-binding protein